MASLEETTEKLAKAAAKKEAAATKKEAAATKKEAAATKKEAAATKKDRLADDVEGERRVEQGAETIEQLRGINEQTAEKITQDSDATGAAAAEEKREAGQSDQERNSYLKQIAGAMGGGAPGDGGGAEAKKKKGLFAGIAGAIGGLGGPVGAGIGAFMKGIGKLGGSAVGFVKAMTFLAAGIAAFAVIIGGATWIISKMMPSIAAGLKEFDGVDGKNLIQVGLGIGALGVGFAAMGGGTALLGIGGLIGGIADGIGGLFGIQSGKQRLIDDLIAFGEVELNLKNIKNNSKAMAAYGVAMTAGAAGDALNAIGGLVSAVFTGLTDLIGGVPLLDKLMAFGEVKVNKGNVINNAEAMEHYMIAMVRGAGAQAAMAAGSVLNFVTTAVDGLTKLIGGQGFLDSTLTGLKKMSEASGSINKDNVENVA